jgi:hypothetical protein
VRGRVLAGAGGRRCDSEERSERADVQACKTHWSCTSEDGDAGDAGDAGYAGNAGDFGDAAPRGRAHRSRNLRDLYDLYDLNKALCAFGAS